MKELFREADSAIVGHMKSILDNEGIATVIRNEHLYMAALSEVPIPEFFPALNVIHDEDYPRALRALKEWHFQCALVVDVVSQLVWLRRGLFCGR